MSNRRQNILANVDGSSAAKQQLSFDDSLQSLILDCKAKNLSPLTLRFYQDSSSNGGLGKANRKTFTGCDLKLGFVLQRTGNFELTLNQSRKLYVCFCGNVVDQIEQLLQGNCPVQRTHFIA